MKENRALSGGLCALGCEVLYGLSYLFTKRTADAASALALLGWRFIVALAVMSLCVALGLVKIRLRGRRLWPLLRVALFCPCLYFIGETVGIRETTVTESGVFLACVPALSLLASAVILKKKPTRRQVVGISITFLGVMTTVIAVGISSSLSPMGYAALMLAVAAYALYSVFVDLASDYTGAEITYAMLLSGAAFYGLLALGEAAAHGALTALLTPVNGSPWEMGKLLYWPYLPAALVIWRMTPERQGRGGHCLLLAAMPLCMTGLCWLLPGRGLRLWSLILAGGLTLHGQVLVRRLRGGELLWYVLAILLGIAYLLLTVRAPSAGPFTDPSAPAMAAIPF